MKKDLSILPYPDPIFVIELDSHILITGFPVYYSSVGLAHHISQPINECKFALYRFDADYVAAFSAAEKMSVEQNKPVANAVDYYIDDPHVYDPLLLEKQRKHLVDIIKRERQAINATTNT
jgi:hypothetical protein